MGLQVSIKIVGTKKAGGLKWVSEAYDMYETRCRGQLELRTEWLKSDNDLVASVVRDRPKLLHVLLEVQGKVGLGHGMLLRLERGSSCGRPKDAPCLGDRV